MSSKSSRTTKTNPADAGPRADLPERVAVGRVLRPLGLRGEVVVQVLSDVPGRLAPGSKVLGAREGRSPIPLVVDTYRDHKTGAVVRFDGFGDRDRAEELRDVLLEVERSEVPEAPEGTYYWYQLIGCRCEVDGEDLGEVMDLVEDGGGLLLVVSDGEREVPIPFVRSFLKTVDVEGGRIELDLPPGLLEACASRS
jgi:16S rRNA processing protein RimM